MITAIAVDDDKAALLILESFCNRLDGITLKRTFSKATEALQYLVDHPVDLIFLDIDMPDISGIEFSRQLPNPAMIVFTTGHDSYAVESYELSALDYIMKPITFERFSAAVIKALERQRLYNKAGELNERNLYLRVDYSLVKIPLSEIKYIEGLDNYLKIHLKGQHPVVVRLTMKAILEKLPDKEFLRVHRSFIVALDKISSVRNKVIKIGDEEIPLGNSFEDEFFSRFQN